MLVVNNKNIPVCLEELSWVDYKFLVECDNLTFEVMLAHFLGLSVEKLREIPISDIPISDIRQALSFISEKELARLKNIEFSLPKFEGVKTGQVLQAFDVLSSEKNVLLATEKIVAIFFFGNIAKLNDCQTLPAYKVIGLGNFFLNSLKKLKPSSAQSIQYGSQAKPRLWQMAVSWLSSIFGKQSTN
jgi:hypothetical protein